MSVGISEALRNFIFTHIDSVELTEVLLLLNSNHGKAWTAKAIAQELRSNTNSIDQRLAFLCRIDVAIRRDSDPPEFLYHVKDEQTHSVIQEFAEAYRIQRHKILELIFSPMKRARDIAEAFRRGSKDKPGRNDG